MVSALASGSSGPFRDPPRHNQQGKASQSGQACSDSQLSTAVSTKVVPQKRKRVRDNADWYYG